jgi:nitroreductase
MPASTPFEALYQICSARNSCRRFSSELIPEEQIENILKLGYTAPFASGRKNWEILVVRDQETIARMVQTVSENVDRLSGQMNEDVAAVFRQYARNFSEKLLFCLSQCTEPSPLSRHWLATTSPLTFNCGNETIW